MKKVFPTVVCFGETLWDLLPSGKKPGGAPINVALHLKKFGINTGVISRIGNDELGSEHVKFQRSNQLNVQFIQFDDVHPTGVVNVKIDQNRNATYDIVFPSAWDFIQLEKGAIDLVQGADYLVFGSLACRNHISKNTLLYLFQYARTKVFDVNLRLPHFTKSLITQLLEEADIVKMNDEELDILNKWFVICDNTYDVICKKLRTIFSIETMIVTLGDKGALVCTGDGVFRNEGYKVKTEDTVGSGDAFLAAYLSKRIEGIPITERLNFACGTGAYVATKAGANPEYNHDDIVQFIETIKY